MLEFPAALSVVQMGGQNPVRPRRPRRYCHRLHLIDRLSSSHITPASCRHGHSWRTHSTSKCQVWSRNFKSLKLVAQCSERCQKLVMLWYPRNTECSKINQGQCCKTADTAATNNTDIPKGHMFLSWLPHLQPSFLLMPRERLQKTVWQFGSRLFT